MINLTSLTSTTRKYYCNIYNVNCWSVSSGKNIILNDVHKSLAGSRAFLRIRFRPIKEAQSNNHKLWQIPVLDLESPITSTLCSFSTIIRLLGPVLKSSQQALSHTPQVWEVLERNDAHLLAFPVHMQGTNAGKFYSNLHGMHGASDLHDTKWVHCTVVPYYGTWTLRDSSWGVPSGRPPGPDRPFHHLSLPGKYCRKKKFRQVGSYKNVITIYDDAKFRQVGSYQNVHTLSIRDM